MTIYKEMKIFVKPIDKKQLIQNQCLNVLIMFF